MKNSSQKNIIDKFFNEDIRELQKKKNEHPELIKDWAHVEGIDEYIWLIDNDDTFFMRPIDPKICNEIEQTKPSGLMSFADMIFAIGETERRYYLGMEPRYKYGKPNNS